METKQIQSKQAVTRQMKTTLKTMTKEVEPIIEGLMQEVESSNLDQSGPLEFIYTGVNTDMEHVFDLEIAVPVATGSKDQDAVKTKNLPELKCVSTLFKGSMDEIDDVYKTIYTGLEQKGIIPTDTVREIYENWVSYSSKENVVEIQVGIN